MPFFVRSVAKIILLSEKEKSRKDFPIFSDKLLANSHKMIILLLPINSSCTILAAGVKKEMQQQLASPGDERTLDLAGSHPYECHAFHS